MSKITLSSIFERRPKVDVCDYLQQEGLSTLTDTDLLAVALSLGSESVQTNDVQEFLAKVLSIIDNGKGIPLFNDLMIMEGLHRQQIAPLLAVMELSRRILFPAAHTIDKPEDIYSLIRHCAYRTEENFWVITLNGAQEVMAIHHVSKGLVNRAIVHPREVFKQAIIDLATAVVVAHNHPSGNVAPSEGDRELTRRLVESGYLLGIPVLDHLIFSHTSYYSFLDNDELTVDPAE